MRFGLAMFMITSAAMLDVSGARTMAALAAAIQCVLLQITALQRSHPRAPLGCSMGVSLAYGALLLAGLCGDSALAHGTAGLAAPDGALVVAALSVAVGLCLLGAALFSRMRSSSLEMSPGYGVLIDAHHKLSPGAKRLLS
eukprot:Transcript_16410.p2 GENE.Transcript_16410~~Transcript_16410.p2  ORF type:complete len:141 (+),score=43.55 Transcript_16410:416-838(+)